MRSARPVYGAIAFWRLSSAQSEFAWVPNMSTLAP